MATRAYTRQVHDRVVTVTTRARFSVRVCKGRSLSSSRRARLANRCATNAGLARSRPMTHCSGIQRIDPRGVGGDVRWRTLLMPHAAATGASFSRPPLPLPSPPKSRNNIFLVGQPRVRDRVYKRAHARSFSFLHFTELRPAVIYFRRPTRSLSP